MDINVIVNQLIELSIIMCLGYALFKFKILTVEFNKKLTRLLLDVTLPCMILASVVKQTEQPPISAVLTIFAVAIALFYIVLPIIGYIITVVLRLPKADRGMYMFMTVFANTAFMGFPVIKALYGGDALFYTAIFNLVFNLAAFTIGIPLVKLGRGEKTAFNPKSLLTPGIVLSVLAIAIYFLRIPSPAILGDAIEMVGDITSPAAMLLIGATLARMNLKEVFLDWRIYPYSLIKQIVVPVILWFPFSMIVHDSLIQGIILIMMAMPVANTAVLFATNYDGNETLAAKIVFMTTLMSLFTIPLVISICL